MALMAAPSDGDSRLPPTYVLRTRHVKAALKGVPGYADDVDVTVWIHSSTLGIEKNCFRGIPRRGDMPNGAQWMESVSRILVYPEPRVEAAVLGALIAKLRAYEPDVVDAIHEMVTHEISDEMYHVGDCAFGYCYGLREAVLPPSITHVGDCAFFDCINLREVVLPPSITHVGKFSFYQCTSLTSVTLPDSLTRVAANVFCCCVSLTSVTFPDSLTHIGNRAFSTCTSLTSVTLPNSLTHIGDGAFFYCTSLTSVTFPNTLTKIEREAFFGCASLTLVTLPDSLTQVGTNAFPKTTKVEGGPRRCVIA
jgi:hypothetical protein